MRREVLPAEMERIILREELLAVADPCYPNGK